jgi:carbon monoxide dehydrogenase subunit G
VLAAAVTIAAPAAEPKIDVTEAGGTYTVSAAFAVAEPAAAVIAVLTDFERIPRFMPDVTLSRIVERSGGAIVVEQEATAKFMMFSKKVHLLLDVQEDNGLISFRDRCGRSFAHYQGSWTITDEDSRAVVIYRLAAKPNFEVPAFVLKRLLKRDAVAMISRLQAEIAHRATP